MKTKIYRWEYQDYGSERWNTYCYSTNPYTNPWHSGKTRRKTYLANKHEMIYLFNQGGNAYTGNLKADAYGHWLRSKGKLY